MTSTHYRCAAPLLAGLCLLLLPVLVAAQSFPTKPIRVVVPFSSGHAWDTRVRQLADIVSKALGQAVVIDNRPGAGGTLGADAVAKAAPDGYTLLAGTQAELAIAPAVYPKLPYDGRRDFTAVTQVLFGVPLLVVNANSELKSVDDLIARAKAKPGQLSAASFGNGTLSHLLIAEFARRNGIDIVHVPYKSAPQALTDVVSGRVSMMFDFYTSCGPFIQAGRVRALMAAGPLRHRALPNVPSAVELKMPTMAQRSWGGILAPRGTPAPVITRLQEAFASASQNPAVKSPVEATGGEIVAGTAAGFAEFLRAEQDRYQALAKSVGVQLE